MRQFPFAKDFSAPTGNASIGIGSQAAWQAVMDARAIGHRNRTLLPPGSLPTSYDWSALRGLGVTVIEIEETSAELRHSTILTLAAFGVREAILIPASHNADDWVFYNCGPGLAKVAA